MYSEFTQQLDIHELESLKDSLEYSATTHVRWISKINQSLVCHQHLPDTMCAHQPSHSHCQLTLWCNSLSNEAVLRDPSFIRLKSLHEELHQKACELIASMQENNPVSIDEYSRFSEIEYEFFKTQASMIQQCTEALGVTDSLTNLPNKRAFHDILLQEENRIKRNKFTSIIAIVDIDNFRVVNETHGYIAGDLLLIQLAALFKSSLRNFDTVTRYAGDKFILYLPETDITSAEVIIERFRESIQNSSFEIAADNVTNITCSFGLSHLDSEISSADALANAWKSLDSAISKGRNIVATEAI